MIRKSFLFLLYLIVIEVNIDENIFLKIVIIMYLSGSLNIECFNMYCVCIVKALYI